MALRATDPSHADKDSGSVPRLTSGLIAARIDRLPPSRWHTKIRAVLATATFFDAFDAVAIAFVMPTLVGLWSLNTGQISLLIASGFAGQAIGALLFSRMSERFGRIRVLNWTIVALSLGGVLCGFAWDYQSLLAFRFFQGVGLGGELPVAAAYVSEISKTRTRGRFFLYYQLMAPLGFMAASVSSIWIVPNLGWHWMFLVGAAPALLTIFIRRMVPESPRWLAQKGELSRADEVTRAIERIIERQTGAALPAPDPEAPEPAERKGGVGLGTLWEGRYRRRTILLTVMWFSQAIVAYGLLSWLPTILRTVYKIPVQEALLLSSIGNVLVLVQAICNAELVDRIGRRPIFLFSFGATTAVLLALTWFAGGISVTGLAILAAVASTTIAMGQFVIWVYTPELYPTRARALGAGVASSWARIGSILAPLTVGTVLGAFGLPAVFALFALFSLAGLAVAFAWAEETRGKELEVLSP